MRFSSNEVYAVKQALRELYVASVPSDLYNSAIESCVYHPDGSVSVNDATVSGTRLCDIACRILEQK